MCQQGAKNGTHAVRKTGRGVKTGLLVEMTYTELSQNIKQIINHYSMYGAKKSP